MNVEIRAEAALFPEKEYIDGIAVAVPSGQIGSTGEWYHWIGLEKNINHYRFLIF
jgi:hypothetical protein